MREGRSIGTRVVMPAVVIWVDVHGWVGAQTLSLDLRGSAVGRGCGKTLVLSVGESGCSFKAVLITCEVDGDAGSVQRRCIGAGSVER